MIKNERQYRITKAEIEKFEQALSDIAKPALNGKTRPVMLQMAQENAIRSQLNELRAQVAEYDGLRSGSVKSLELFSLSELPEALIKSRIAAGLTQRQLAESLNLKEQQIQRYEATDYASVSLSKLLEIAETLGIQVREDVILPSAKISATSFIDNLSSLGISEELITSRLLPPEFITALQGGEHNNVENVVIRAASRIGNIYGISAPALLTGRTAQVTPNVGSAVRFKVSPKANNRQLQLYTTYAYYVARLILQTVELPVNINRSMDPLQVNTEIIQKYKRITLESVLHYIWDMGIPVVPLDDAGGFHGACWRIDYKNIIVLKQRTDSEARWLFDSLHEYGHTGEEPSKREFAVIDEDVLRQDDEREKGVNDFSADVLLNGKADKLVDICMAASRRNMDSLKSTVEEVANNNNVRVDVLANYLAYKLSSEGKNWWAIATSLQKSKIRPFEIARRVFFQRVNLQKLTASEQELVIQALSDGM